VRRWWASGSREPRGLPPWCVPVNPPSEERLVRTPETPGKQHQMAVSVPVQLGHPGGVFNLKRRHDKYDASPGNKTTLRFPEDLLPLGRPSGVARMGPFEGSDQLVGPPANQGQIGSSISTARHVPRPPNIQAMQHVKVSDRHPPADRCNSVYDRVESGRCRRSNLGFHAPISTKCRPCVASRQTSTQGVCASGRQIRGWHSWPVTLTVDNPLPGRHEPILPAGLVRWAVERS
jgi:hypothetical protein